MHRMYYIIPLFFFYITFKAQQDKPQSYVGKMNEMFSSAPTSNNLMKFEEVPVSYYTGIPDINIPLFTIPTKSKDVSMNIQLKYHPLNAKPQDKSGETGLGWSLLAGGTIARTVRGGNADEKTRIIEPLAPIKQKYGIYNHTYNPTYKILTNDPTFDFNQYTFDAFKGKFDTEYDLYQYNFMNYTGRFYVIKNPNGTLKVEKLDKNNLDIVCSGTGDTIINFTITDEKGIKYVFTAKETASKEIQNVKIGILPQFADVNSTIEIGNFYTSFHLVNIRNQNNENLVTFEYDLQSLVSETNFQTTTRTPHDVSYYNPPDANGNINHPNGSLPGSLERQTIESTTQTKLLTRILVQDIAELIFNYDSKQENNIFGSGSHKLKSIQSKIINQNQDLEKYNFEYATSSVNFKQNSYTSTILNKLLLKKVIKTINNQNFEYTLSYNENSSLLEKDKWGYFKVDGISLNNEITTDVLKSIIYPTKGKVMFNFEENEYSYHPTPNDQMIPVTGYTTTDEFESTIGFNSFSTSYKQHFFNIQSPQTVNLHLYLGNLLCI